MFTVIRTLFYSEVLRNPFMFNFGVTQLRYVSVFTNINFPLLWVATTLTLVYLERGFGDREYRPRRKSVLLKDEKKKGGRGRGWGQVTCIDFRLVPGSTTT